MTSDQRCTDLLLSDGHVPLEEDSMTSLMSRAAIIAALLGTTTSIAQAQTERSHIGPRVSYQFDLEEIGIGGQFGARIGRQLEFYPSFDYFFVDNGSFWQLNADLKYGIVSEAINWLYLGGGLNLARSDAGTASEARTRAGANLFAGAESRRGRVHPFAEFRVVLRDGSAAQLAAGLNITLDLH
jgi:hypothetical protein